jgi:hypothetical protein
MEQKFGTAVAISERLIHMAYSNRLSPVALHHEALIEAVKYINEIARNSDMLSFVHQPSDLFLGPRTFSIVHLKTGRENFCAGAPRTTSHASQPDATFRVHPTADSFQLLRQRLGYSRSWRNKHDCSRTLAILPTSLLH